MPPTGRRRPNSKLRAKRLERGLSQEELADELSLLRWQSGPDSPAISGAMVSMWERGVRPRPHHRRLLSELLGASLDDLDLHTWPALVGSAPEPVHGRYDGGPGGAATKRRAFLVGAAGTIASLAGAPMADPLLTALSRLNHLAGSSIGTAVDGFEAVVAELAVTYSKEPVMRLYARLDGLLATVQTIIDSGPPAAYRRRLRSVAGWTASMLANALGDLGDPTAARANAALALEYGRLADDVLLMAYACDRQAMFAADANQLPAALQLVQKGLHMAPAGNAVSVRLRAAESHLNARLGRELDARAALGRFEAEFEQLPVSEIGEDQFTISTALPDTVVGRVLTRLGDGLAAEPRLRRATRYWDGPERRPTRLAENQLDLAMALLLLERPDEAAALGDLALSTDRLTAGLVRKAGLANAALTERWPELPEARQFRERYLALEAATQPPAEA